MTFGDMLGGHAKSKAAEEYYGTKCKKLSYEDYEAERKPNPAYMNHLPKLPFAMNNSKAHNRIKKLNAANYQGMFTAPTMQKTVNTIQSICSEILNYERQGHFAKNGRSQRSWDRRDRWDRALARPRMVGSITRPIRQSLWDN